MENHEQNLEPTPAQSADSYRRALLGTVIRYEGRSLGLHHAAHGDALYRASGLFDLTTDGELETDTGKSVRDFLSDLRKSPESQHLFSIGEPALPARSATSRRANVSIWKT